MRRGTLKFSAFIMVPKMENKLGFIQIICSLYYLISLGVLVTIKLEQE